MPGFGVQGILLEQNKEPALSREIKKLKGCDECERRLEKPVSSEPGLLAPYEIVMIAREAKIIDESDGRRLWRKLAQAARESISGVVIDAMDDEPYLSSQLGPALWMQDQLSEAIGLVKRAVGANKVQIEIYKNLLDVDIKIPASIGGNRVERIGGTYPAELRARWHSSRKNTLVIGAGAMIHLWRAAYLGLVQTTCFVTVAGDCVANPGNYEVPIGMSVMRVAEQVGLIADPKRMVAGGSMTGFGLTDPERVMITPTTRGVLAFAQEFKDMGYTCIGCGRCADVCPEGLSPFFIYKAMKSKRRERLELFDADLCTGCGTCSYVCPAKLDLAQIVGACGRLVRKQNETVPERTKFSAKSE